jgi:2',3'-cyclic-nucleotide 2'-phosphodiesterase (5'-nucleotidase family)
LGGLSKKAAITKQLSADASRPALIVNSGNLLFPTDVLPPEDMAAARITAGGVIEANRKMGAGVAGVGSRDLAAGVAFLRQYQKPPEWSWVSLNLVDPGTRKPLLAPVLWRQVNGLKVAVLGLVDPETVRVEAGEALTLSWRDSLPAVLAEVKGKADFILLLSNYSLADNQDIARSNDGIDLILQAGHVVGNMTPLTINKTLITQTETRGKYLGVLDVNWNGHGRWQEGDLSSPAATEGKASVFANRFVALKLSVVNDPEVEAVVRQTQGLLDKQPHRAQ